MSKSMDVHLKDSQNWEQYEDLYAKGRGSIDGEFKDTAELLDLFAATQDLQELEDLVQRLDGFFAVLSIRGNDVTAVVDRINSTPLYYSQTAERVLISNDAHWVQRTLEDTRRDTLADLEFVLGRTVIGNRTRSQAVEKIEPGHLIQFSREGGEYTRDVRQYYRYMTADWASVSDEEAIDRGIEALETAFERLVSFADGRTIVVPLSGGFDSMLVLSMLNRVGYDDLLSYCYGWDAMGSDIDRSQELAELFNVPWEFVPLVHDDYRNWDDAHGEVVEYVGTLDTMPRLSHGPALQQLEADGKIPHDAIFTPGHTPSHTGKHMPQHMAADNTLTEPTKFAEDLILNYFKGQWRWTDSGVSDHLMNTILAEMEKHGMVGMKVPDAFEYWDWKEEETHFIKQVQIYEYMSYDWWAPLFDRAYMNLLSSMPPHLRHNRRLHDAIAKRVCSAEADTTPSFLTDPQGAGVTDGIVDRLKDYRVVKRVGQRVLDYTGPDVVSEYDSDPRYAVIDREDYEEWTRNPVRLGEYEIVANKLSFDELRTLDLVKSEQQREHTLRAGS